MAENPLLPNTKLRELYALTERAERLRSSAPRVPPIEALLAATLLHVEPGDFVSAPEDARAAAVLAPERTAAAGAPTKPTDTSGQAPPLRFASTAGVARGLVHAGSDRFALLYGDAGPRIGRDEPAWPETLRFAMQMRLPLIVAVAAVAAEAGVQDSEKPKAEDLTWTTVSKLSRQSHIPVLSVDGTDAVAIYRAMQEAVLRVRHGDGPVVLWCLLPMRRSPRGREPSPLEKLRSYLAARKIALPKATAKRTRTAG